MSLDFNKLKDNCVVLSGFQYIEQSPLGFFEFDNPSEADSVFKHRIDGFTAKGKITVKSDGFKPIKNADGQNKANSDTYVVTRAKSRPVLIFQNIEFSKQFNDNVFIIPIQTLREPLRDKCNSDEVYLERLKEYNDIKNKSTDVYDMYYAPKNVNDSIWERVLVLSDSRFVHASTLHGQIFENEISKEDLEQIGIRLGKLLNIEKLEKCAECTFNYNNYVLKEDEEKSS